MSVTSSARARSDVEHPRDDPTLERAPAPLAACHRVLGFTLLVETNDERIQAAADDSFGPRLDPSVTPELRVRLLTHGVAEDAGWQPRQPIVRQQGDLLSISASRATTVVGDKRAGTALGFVSEEAADTAEFLRAAIVQSVAFTLAQARSLVAVHSACIVKDGRALMLRGVSGAGKTTLTYAALRHGWSLLAEDVIFIRASRDPLPDRLAPADLWLHGVPWNLYLLPDAALLFPELAGEPTFERLNGERKLAVRIEQHFPGQTQADAPLGPLVFVDAGYARAPVLHTLDRDAALARLRDTAIMDEPQVARDRELWDAFLMLPAYWLETGDDLDANAAALEVIIT